MDNEITDSINLLVYGTLRPGQYNDARLGGLSSLAAQVVPGIVVNGKMFNVRPGYPGYPVVDFGLEGRVVGDLLVGLPVQSDQFQGVHYMEKNAGYRLVQIGTFETFEGPAAVHSYQYDTEYRSVGQLIPDGDWVEFVEAFDRAEARR